MHSTHLSFQGFQGKVGPKGDVVSRNSALTYLILLYVVFQQTFSTVILLSLCPLHLFLSLSLLG